MARWEHEDVSDLNIPDPIGVETQFLDIYGKIATEDEAVAKSTKGSDGSQRFYIKYGRNELLDPHNIDSSRAQTRRQKHLYTFKEVSQPTFENYTKYLNSKNRLYFTRARRLLMEN